MINGDGDRKPAGLLADTSGALYGATAESSTEITCADVIALVNSLEEPYRENAAFLCNPVTLDELKELSKQVGDRTTLLGYPVHTSEFMPILAAGQKVLVFGDYRYYDITEDPERIMARDDDTYAMHKQIGFLIQQRVGGRLSRRAAVRYLVMREGE